MNKSPSFGRLIFLVSISGLLLTFQNCGSPLRSDTSGGNAAQSSVSPWTNKPTVNAGADQNIKLPINSVSLLGSVVELEGAVVSTQWSQLSGPNTAMLSGEKGLTLIASNLVAGTYFFSLLATDNYGASQSDEVIVVVAPATAPVVDPAIKTLVNQSLNLALTKLSASVAYSVANGNSTVMMPRSTTVDGTWNLVGPQDDSEWTAGFFPGCLWQIYKARSGNLANLANARKFTAYLANVRAPKTNPPPLNYLHGNLGFDMKNSYLNKLELDSSATDADKANAKSILMRSAQDLRGIYDANIGAVIDRGTWVVSGTPAYAYVPIDYMMILEPLFWSAKNGGDPDDAQRAIQHATTIMKNHVRKDGSTFHHVLFNQAGGVVSRVTHQGFSDNSTWTRGQAWAIYGFTMVYRETGRPEFLATATKVADYFLQRLPADGIPPWDFDAVAPVRTNKDSSAAAIAASGLLELSQLTQDPILKAKYLAAAEKILTTLMSATYMSPNSAQLGLLLHGVGNIPAGSEIDVSLIYGDYYFLEALNRYRTIYAF